MRELQTSAVVGAPGSGSARQGRGRRRSARDGAAPAAAAGSQLELGARSSRSGAGAQSGAARSRPVREPGAAAQPSQGQQPGPGSSRTGRGDRAAMRSQVGETLQLPQLSRHCGELVVGEGAADLRRCGCARQRQRTAGAGRRRSARDGAARAAEAGGLLELGARSSRSGARHSPGQRAPVPCGSRGQPRSPARGSSRAPAAVARAGGTGQRCAHR